VCESLVKVTKPAQEVETTKIVAEDTIKKIIISLPGKRENKDTTLLKENTEPVSIPIQKEIKDTTLHKEISETAPLPVIKANVDSSVTEEYSEGVSLFREKKYDDALLTFGNVLKKRIGAALAGNCEYWMGECEFATRNYTSAKEHFQNVLANESSKKKPDAYFMLGRSFDQIGEFEKALTVYQELNEQYPNNVHSHRVKSRLNELQRLLDEKGKTGDEIQK
jgi:tol-pal system protein YbgF